MTKKYWLIFSVLFLAFAISSFAYYDPKTVSFISRDPIREEGGINLYAYCNNDPIGNFDPIGEAALLVISNPADYERVKALQAAGLGFYDGVTLEKGFGVDGEPNRWWTLAQLVNDMTDIRGHRYNAAKIAGTRGIWFFDNTQQYQGVKKVFDTAMWTVVGLQTAPVVLSAGFAGLAGGDIPLPNESTNAPNNLPTTPIERGGAEDTQLALHQDQIIMNNYQRYYNDAWRQAVQEFNAGRITVSDGQNWKMVLGQHTDLAARVRLRSFLRSAEIPEGPGTDVLVNRWLRDPLGSGSYRIPDLQLMQTRNILDGTIGDKTLDSPQIRDFIDFSEGSNIIIVRPTVSPGFGEGN